MKKLEITKYKISSTKITGDMDGFSMAVLADLHNCQVGGDNSLVDAALERENPDCVLLAGDMVSEKSDGMGAGVSYHIARELVLRLAAKYPVYYVFGNHESRWRHNSAYHTKSIREYIKELEAAGVVVLDNISTVLRRKNGSVRLAGLDLPLSCYSKKKNVHLTPSDIKRMLGNPDGGMFTVLLTHSPVFFRSYAAWGADLTLAGHMHGGTVRVPKLGGVLSPYYKFFPKYDRGMYADQATGARMIVSAGLGTHTLPLRINNPPELVIVGLEPMPQ